MVKKIGIIGFSEGNGHPYSFSAIFNGYQSDLIRAANWPVIADYLDKKDKADFGISSYHISHVWSQDHHESIKIQKACYIEYVSKSLDEMCRDVDVVIIARDDVESHYELAKSFLESKKSVFIDKPLTLSLEHLSFFEPYLKSGQLMSCSSLRYAKELDDLKLQLQKKELGKIHLIKGTVIGSWEKYGIHLLEAIQEIIPFTVEAITEHKLSNKDHRSFILECDKDLIITIDVLEKTTKIFQLDFHGEKGHFTCNISDNFSSFKRTLTRFVKQFETNIPQISPLQTIHLMKILIAGNLSRQNSRRIPISEINS